MFPSLGSGVAFLEDGAQRTYYIWRQCRQ